MLGNVVLDPAQLSDTEVKAIAYIMDALLPENEKILNAVARLALGENLAALGQFVQHGDEVVIFTERTPCGSCSELLKAFGRWLSQRGIQLDVKIVWFQQEQGRLVQNGTRGAYRLIGDTLMPITDMNVVDALIRRG